ncbi:hypothetical protein [Citreimonas sp.]|uniref:hypothetical protein n=1 Tax=Citreimonas sp. TaxID=3036715 RepID=UPI004059FB83
MSHSISGKLTASDWRNQKAKLTEGGSEAIWAETFELFLMKRLRSRYFEPLEILQREGKLQGEGFTITSIQCAVIEFLAALRLGKNYRYVQNRSDLGEHEYMNSSSLFCEFLISESPFNDWIKTIAEARNFYSSVRCALLHEARTKDGWKIWATGEIGIEPSKKIVRRDALQGAINSYLEKYGILLLKDHGIQSAFIRKFDHLADT